MRRIYIALLVLALGGIAVPRAVLYHKGFCFSESRYLSDREKIQAAVERVLASAEFGLQVVDAATRDTVRGRAATYGSATDFLRAYPECCRIGPEGAPDQIPVESGTLRVTIVVIDLPHIRIGNGPSERVITAQANVVVDACGKVKSNYGFREISRIIRENTHG